MDLNLIWTEFLSGLEVNMSDVAFNTWIEPLEPIKLISSELIISAPNGFTKKMIESKYLNDMIGILSIILKKDATIKIILPTDNTYKQYQVRTKPGGQQYFADLTENNNGKKPIDVEKIKMEQMLNPKYTFDTFVKGKSNEFALSAALAVSKNPASAYNPLFIYGGPGLGKTHLMQACAHEIIDHNPEAKVVYLSSEKFVNELISSIGDRSNKKNSAFRNKYRNIDVLLIDDIQFIAGKTGTQEEFFHTFNDLYAQNKQIIISSDKPPKEIKDLEERLISRFEWGLMADIQLPDYETRVAILQAKLNMENANISRDILEYIAMNVKSNIRELEGALMTVIAHSKLLNEPNIDLERAKIALRKVIAENEKRPITLDLIQEIVADQYHITVSDLSSKNRSKQIAYPRQIAMYLCRNLTDSSLIAIANSFNRDHTTIMHGVDKISKDISNDENFEKEINELIDLIKNE
ncbi:chromosomal replication initiator protein DnaA [Miniphocaeibacter halophilus]|uniref:Chromosomal replication initiator protein DnaA n=1 Tax=Miniphocaeibacter halophilus TaxID=2931922 RepID=A0AC61MTN8_9FIRM|nr:chromosomal replication initiator protein DnaA [Miniphocaeibacter halophilus]QQK08912.1 chromosomal replication initiator protein DnaA [Miniphocaeibacter halophilus]